MSAHLKVVRAGLFDTMQDLGRIGFMALGMPTAGAMDRVALRLANALCDNAPGTAGLEIGVMGPDLLVEADSVRIALVGPLSPGLVEAPDAPTKPLESDRTHLLKRGQVLKVGMVEGSSTAYLAVAGGFALPPFMGSLSTYARAGVGGQIQHFVGRTAHLHRCRLCAAGGDARAGDDRTKFQVGPGARPRRVAGAEGHAAAPGRIADDPAIALGPVGHAGRCPQGDRVVIGCDGRFGGDPPEAACLRRLVAACKKG